jgi:hypothetical protein
MIAKPAIPHPAAVPHPFTLNDLRVHSSIAKEPSSTSALTLSGRVLAVVLAISAFIWLDPLRLFTPTDASPPGAAFISSAEPARPTARQEIIAPLTLAPATKSVAAPIVPVPVVQAPHVSVLVVQKKTDAPIVLKLGDDTKNAPKPAAAKDQTPVTE